MSDQFPARIAAECSPRRSVPQRPRSGCSGYGDWWKSPSTGLQPTFQFACRANSVTYVSAEQPPLPEEETLRAQFVGWDSIPTGRDGVPTYVSGTSSCRRHRIVPPLHS